MIAISASSGELLRVLPSTGSEIFGFHRIFGFISERASQGRVFNRKRFGLRNEDSDWLCRFRVASGSPQKIEVQEIDGCQVLKRDQASFELSTAFGKFTLSPASATSALDRAGTSGETEESKDRLWLYALAACLAIIFMIRVIPQPEAIPVAAEEIIPVAVKIMPERQKPVTVPVNVGLPKLVQKVENVETRRAVQQQLGFLGLLGRKDLTKAIGGAPTKLQNASPGAGPGGTQGSGGELLAGLGQGVKRTTVGNTGVAGLGGVGTKGAGGGAGGYGNSMVGSGEGKGLSSMALSQDVVMEGGLDRSVIQATIAKYLSQVRACYEEGLRSQPGLAGQVSVGFEVGPEGALNFARVSKSSLNHAGVEGCITTKMMGWKFPKPLGGVNVKVNYPFLLRPVS